MDQEKPAPIGRWWRRVRLEDQAEKVSGPKWRRVVRQVRTGETAPCLTEEEEPWNVSDLTIVFEVLSPLFKQVQKGFPRSTQVQSIMSLHVVWMHFQFNGFPYESVHK